MAVKGVLGIYTSQKNVSTHFSLSYLLKDCFKWCLMKGGFLSKIPYFVEYAHRQILNKQTISVPAPPLGYSEDYRSKSFRFDYSGTNVRQ